MFKTITILLINMLFVSFMTYSQSENIANKKVEKYPTWISMQKDSAVNYFEAVEAFEIYWSARPKPVEEEDILGDPNKYTKKQGFLDKLIISKQEKRKAESQMYAFEYKSFKQWQLRVAPWVSADGQITPLQERLKIWQTEQNKNNNAN